MSVTDDRAVPETARRRILDEAIAEIRALKARDMLPTWPVRVSAEDVRLYNHALANSVLALERLRDAPAPRPEPQEAAGVLGEAENDWQNAAYRVGEALAANGPDGYYAFTPSQWATWALSCLPSPPDVCKPNRMLRCRCSGGTNGCMVQHVEAAPSAPPPFNPVWTRQQIEEELARLRFIRFSAAEAMLRHFALMPWLPIATAPKGVDVVVREGAYRLRVAYHSPAGWRTTPGDIGVHPTHWIDLATFLPTGDPK